MSPIKYQIPSTLFESVLENSFRKMFGNLKTIVSMYILIMHIFVYIIWCVDLNTQIWKDWLIQPNRSQDSRISSRRRFKSKYGFGISSQNSKIWAHRNMEKLIPNHSNQTVKKFISDHFQQRIFHIWNCFFLSIRVVFSYRVILEL